MAWVKHLDSIRTTPGMRQCMLLGAEYFILKFPHEISVSEQANNIDAIDSTLDSLNVGDHREDVFAVHVMQLATRLYPSR